MRSKMCVAVLLLLVISGYVGVTGQPPATAVPSRVAGGQMALVPAETAATAHPPTASPDPMSTSAPTDTFAPTFTPLPTGTPGPLPTIPSTAMPTAGPALTATPEPTRPPTPVSGPIQPVAPARASDRVQLFIGGRVFLPLVQNAPAVPTAQNTPAPPPPPPAPAGEFQELVSLTSPTTPGANATITVRTLPGVRCSITVWYKSGPSRAQGLNPMTAGGDGVCSWTWKVGTNTTPGTWRIEVTTGNTAKNYDFVVQ